MGHVAIIPARGGSKRLPRKNVLPILGIPMLQYPIKSALESGLFDEIIVSTEDDEISMAAKEAGARVIVRPVELAGDRSTVVQVCLHVLDVLEREHLLPAYFCCLYATAVMIKPENIRESYFLLKEEPEADFVMGVSEYSLHPVKALVEKEKYLKPMWPEYQGIQSQFYPKLVCSNGTLYWADVTCFRETKSFYGKRLKGYEVPRIYAVDIDTVEDYELVKAIAAQMWSKNREK